MLQFYLVVVVGIFIQTYQFAGVGGNKLEGGGGGKFLRFN